MGKVPNVYVVAGPNGSGKTTFAREFLPNYAKCNHFVNADLIANGLSPFDPRIVALKAGKLVLTRIREFTKSGEDFGFETTLSGRSHFKMFRRLNEAGYKVHLFFLWVPGVDLSLLRVKNRVAEGGHDVLANDVRRRFPRSIANFFKAYSLLADTWMLFDNSGEKPALAAKGSGSALTVENQQIYRMILESVNL